MIFNINNESFLKEYSNTIRDLKTLANLKKNNKLYINNNILYIDDSYKYLQGLYRWLYSQSRNDSLNYIESLIVSIKNMMTNLKLSQNSSKLLKKKKNRNKNNKYENISKYITELIDKINLAYIGLESLKITYFNDTSTINKINKFQLDLKNI